jgi:hypothetical protein
MFGKPSLLFVLNASSGLLPEVFLYFEGHKVEKDIPVWDSVVEEFLAHWRLLGGRF